MTEKPLIMFVGRPNVGKSSLFNKIVGRRVSVVHDSVGVTRDLVYASCQWNGREAVFADTGGLELDSKDLMFPQIKEKIFAALKKCVAVVFVVDVKVGRIPADEKVAEMLKKSKIPVILCVNKCDECEPNLNVYDFYSLGFGKPIEVSSIHGHGTGDLLDKIFEFCPYVAEETDGNHENEIINVAIIGKPNVGKSSLLNRICGEERSIVSNVPGTTRDALDMLVVRNGMNYVFIDTAGMRKNNFAKDDIERYSVMRAGSAVERCDVCVFMVDASEGVTEQDVRVGGISKNSGKACVILVNKWDKIDNKEEKIKELTEKIKNEYLFMRYAPVIFISAKTGQRTEKIFEIINTVFRNYSTRISTGLLNSMLAEIMERTPPPRINGKQLKIYYMTQASAKPPTFVFFVNKGKLFHFSYQRHIENVIREKFDFNGTPVKFSIREKREKK
jgi:GTP-binding protein